MDDYFYNPRGVATLRALSGLGDPQVEPFYSRAALGEADEALVGRMVPQDERSQYVSTENCRVDYALEVAKARIAALGPDHPYVRQWFATQNAVFSACLWDKSQHAHDLPPPLRLRGPRLAKLQRDDRAYQAAALLFYRKDPDAGPAFRRIAASSSPHAAIAVYMTLANEVPDIENTHARQRRALMTRARAILANSRYAGIHPLVQALVGSVAYWSRDPELRQFQVQITLQALEVPARGLADSPTRERYARALADIDKLHRQFAEPDWWLTRAIPSDATASRAMADRAANDPFVAWLLVPESPFDTRAWIIVSAPRSDRRWRAVSRYAERQDREAPGLQWKVVRASLMENYGREQWGEIARLAAKAKAGDQAALAAAPTLFYHQVRTALLYSQGKERDEAFAAVLQQARAWPYRDGAHFVQAMQDALAYLSAAGRLAEARQLRDAGLVPADGDYSRTRLLLLLAEDEDEVIKQLPAALDSAPGLLNLLSIAKLERLARRPDVPVEARALFARVAWTRLYALERRILADLDLLMRRLNPEITGAWISPVGARPDNRALLLDVLRSPGLNILITENRRAAVQTSRGATGLTGTDLYLHSDNNWWCAWESGRHVLLAADTLYLTYFDGPSTEDYNVHILATLGAPAALEPLLRSSWLWQGQDRDEAEALAHIASAPELLTKRAIDWSENRGWFGRREGRDEALALAVRATRYGCQRQGGHGTYSRKAFALLHRKFPDSLPAKRTPYWFDCAHFTDGCKVTPPTSILEQTSRT
ncbi:hypothetical protein [Sphingomonas sp.]|uniref:hypothetical protein n=1 Tax=Sphingomonas sp. TaxID=28214 RepID=UPI002FC92095